jgi:outer membrane receptor protein involved in Fe transport
MLVICVLGTTPLPAQVARAAASSESVAYSPAPIEQTAADGVTLDMEDVTPIAALQAIASSAGLHLIVQDDLLPGQHISVHVRNRAPLAAVRQVLRGTALVAHVTPTGLLIITTDTNIAAAAAPAVIAGVITETSTTHPIGGATVILDGSASRITKNDGTFRFGGVAPGAHTVAVRRLGYVAATRRVSVGDGATATVDIALTAAAKTLDQVVVTGTVTPTERRAVPNSISVITSQDIEERGVTDINEIFRGSIPGVFGQSRGEAGTSTNGYGNTYVTARGVSTVGSTAIAAVTPIKTYVDGVEIAYPFYLQSIDPRTIERIELIPGPQASTIYGSGALGGVLQIFTKRGSAGSPHFLLGLATGAVQSSYNTSLTPRNDITGQFSGGDGSALTYSAGGGYTYTGQWLPGLYRRDANGYVAATYVASKSLSTDVSLRASQRASGANAYTFLVEGERTGLYSYNPGDFAPSNVTYSTKTQTVGAGATWQPYGWWRNRLDVGTDQTDQASYKNDPTYLTASDSLRTIVAIPNRKQTVRFSTTLQGQVAKMVSGNLTAGADAMQYESQTEVANSPALTGTLSGGANSPPFVSRTTESQRGAFLQGQLAVAEFLYLTAGVRGEHDSNYGSNYGTNYAPRYGASLVHEIGPVTAKVRVAYGRATRAPASGVRQAVFLTNTTYGTYQSQIAAPELGPESQSGTESGLELYWGSRANLQITHYDQHVDNLIISVPVDSVQSLNPNAAGNYTFATVSQRQNVGAVRNQGWEGQAELNLVGGLTLNGTLSDNITRFQHLAANYTCTLAVTQRDQCLYPGASLFNLAEHTGSLAANFARSRLNLNVSMSYIGQRRFAYDIGDYYAATNGRLSRSVFTYVPVTAPAYETFDVRGAYQINPEIQATLSVQNAGNSHDGDYTGRRFLPAIGRSTMLGVRISH